MSGQLFQQAYIDIAEAGARCPVEHKYIHKSSNAPPPKMDSCANLEIICFDLRVCSLVRCVKLVGGLNR